MILFTGECVCAIPACIAGGIPACLAAGLRSRGEVGIPACLACFQAHTQGGSLGGSGPGPQPRGKLRGIWSRPTPKGEVEGDLAKGDVPAPGGWCLLRGRCGDPLPVTATAAGGTHPTGMHSCSQLLLMIYIFNCSEFMHGYVFLGMER